MARTLVSNQRSRSLAIPIALCSLIALAPSAWLEVVTPIHWQHEIIHLTGGVGIGLAAAWPWSVRQGPTWRRRFYIWLLLGGFALTVYVVTVSPLFLLVGFSVLFTGMLDIWVARAHVASNEYRDRLERRANT